MPCFRLAAPPKTSPYTLLPGPDSRDIDRSDFSRDPAPSTAGSRTPELRTSALSLPRPARLILAEDRGTRQTEGRQGGGVRGHRTSSSGPGPGKSPTSSPVAPRHQCSLNIARFDSVIKRSLAPGERLERHSGKCSSSQMQRVGRGVV